MRNSWIRFAAVLVIMAIAAGAAAGYSKAIQHIVNAFEASSATVIYWGPLLVIGLSALKGTGQFIHTVLLGRTMSKIDANIKKELYNVLLQADMEKLQEEAPAALATRFTADIGLIMGAAGAIFGSIRAFLIIMATFVVMLTIDWAMTIGLAAIFSLALYPVNLIGRRVRSVIEKTQRQIAVMNMGLTEGLSGIRVTRTYQLEDHMGRGLSSLFDNLRVLGVRNLKLQARISPVMEMLGGVAVAALLFIVSWRMAAGTTNMADFMGLLTGLGVIVTPARQIGNLYATIQQGNVAMERIFSLFDAQNSIVDIPGAKELQRVKGAMEFNGVGFTYSGEKSALSNVNFKIEPGTKVAFVGRSGAGKSTIFNLIPRMFDVSDGSVKIDGHDIREVTIKSLRRQIAVVGQDSFLFTGSVADNIGFGKSNATREQIQDAAKAAAAHGFIEELPNGYDTHISPSSGMLSGGERQRLSIARAILRDAPILLLDEPTSSLDAESEMAIRTALKKLSRNRTTLIIAHRLSTILDADSIIVLDNGEVAERGNHNELLARGGIYSELYSLQFQGVEEVESMLI
ncbi:MAG: ATP-binding cassette domain-containing protein [Roseovarius sp.]|nr:ATP-binding cassette domain-containing protein [Roseovarius sp.]MCY4208605.1 ATP-binding cassette domain-containing protein [Roseovarius sp.]MCY4290780.1 ATP-binding cassette domain-containing protein [Roseovarius sp.]MCY4315722.1 ATP-binding cassette domain-containing protein [Roseovarius sp.]